MTATELKKYWHASPFIPFDIVMSGSQKLPVPHPDFLNISPSGRIAILWLRDEDWTSVDIFMITALETRKRNAKRKRAKG